MPLSGTQLDYLRNADQRFRCHFGLFDGYAPVVTPQVAGTSGTLMSPKPMPMISPRRSLVAFSGSITLRATDTYNRGGAYVGNGNIAWALEAGSAGSLVDNGNGTATYTAPASTAATAQINMTATNANGTRTGYAFVQYPKTTYDEVVAELASITGSLTQHGWKALIRIKGAGTGFGINKTILLHIEDTWDGTTNTFGGYQYSEGVLVGVITEMQYFEDGAGETWLGLQIESPWYWLTQMKMGETFWGRTAASSRFYMSGFAPVDSVWHFVNSLTNYSQYFNCTLWFDGNSIDDFIIDQSDLGTIIEDVMARTLAITYSDRYGSLFCVPDPDVRADEYWGTPSSWAVLDSTLVKDYTLTYHPYTVRKLTVAAVDNSKLGIYAISENTATAVGGIEEIKTLICNNAYTLASWAGQKRAQMNRKWSVDVNLPLNHVPDLNNFWDVVFTATQQSGVITASGQAYIDSISYRPDIYNGGWESNWHLLKRTEDDTDGVSSWGGTGIFQTGTPPFTGSAVIGSGTGGWGYVTGGVGSAKLGCFNVFLNNLSAESPFVIGSGKTVIVIVSGTAQTSAQASGGLGYYLDPGFDYTFITIQIDNFRYIGGFQGGNAAFQWSSLANSANHVYGQSLVATANTTLSAYFAEIEGNGHLPPGGGFFNVCVWEMAG